jgi:hypothetical protein
MKKNITQPKQKRLSIISLLFLFGSLVFLSSCANEPKDELNKKINKALRSGNEITENERNEFIEYINENSLDLPQIIDRNNEINQEELTNLILSVANKRRNSSEPIIFSPEINVADKRENTVINVFIENSGSMDGYVRGITDFEIAIGKMLVLSKDYNEGGLNVNFINKNVYPAPEIKELTDFARALEPKTGSLYYDKGTSTERSESILNDVLKRVLDSTAANGISILVSDCIYSLKEIEDTKGSLGYQQNGTMEAFLNKFRAEPSSNLTTSIYKMNSNYNGKYYPYDYKRSLGNFKDVKNKERPYYIWIIGEDKNVNQFLEKVKIEDLKGFENSYYLSNSRENQQPFYTVLRTTNKIGKFRPTDKKSSEIKSINEIEFDNGLFQFSVAVDLKGIPVDDAYLKDTRNYNKPDGFSIISIEEIDINKLDKNDYTRISKTNASHFITIQFNRDYDFQDLNLELSNKIPSWVEESSSIDDRDVENELDKTFGLLYLVHGVSEAYTTQNPNNKSYFNINIEIKK